MRTYAPIDPAVSVAVKASAGSGKTFTLSLRYVNLLLHGVDPGRILCITFTNKATNEMYRRILSLLKYLAFELSPVSINDEARCLLAMRGAVPSGQPGDAGHASPSGAERVVELRDNAARVYGQVARDLTKLRISTIDSFFNGILRVFPFEAGVMPDFRIITDRERQLSYSEAFQDFIADLEGNDEVRNLLSAIMFMSGKAIYSPSAFLYPHFQKLFEMRVSAERVIHDRLECVRVADARGCIDLVNADLKRLGGAERAVRKRAREFSETLIRRCPGMSGRGIAHLSRYMAANPAELATLTSIVKDEYDEFQYFKKCGHDEGIQETFVALRAELSRYLELRSLAYKETVLFLFSMFTAYLDARKAERNGLAFSDVTDACYRLLVDNAVLEGASDYFYFRLDGRIDHLLIDEFQDTNLIQWLILKPLVDELTSGIGQHDRQGSFFYVGDPKQSIYRFRGGESRLFDRVLEQYRGKVALVSLYENFRSSKAVVDFVNLLFGRIGKHLPFDYEIQECQNMEDEGCVDVRVLPRGSSPANKREVVCEWIRGIEMHGHDLGDIAILCSDNRQCEEYAESLSEIGIPAITEGSMSILHSPGVDALVEILKYLRDGSEVFHLMNFLFSVPTLLSPDEMRLAITRGTIPEWVNERLQGIVDQLGLVPVVNVIRMLVDEFELFSRFDGDANILLLVDLAGGPDIQNPLSVGDFLEHVALTFPDVRAEQLESLHAVRVLTIHKSKGLEFPFVIVPELDIDVSIGANTTPLIAEYDADLSVRDLHFNESRDLVRFQPKLHMAVQREGELILRDRLNQLYVALTRARRGLFSLVVPGGEGARRLAKLSDIICDVLDGHGYGSGSIPDARTRPQPTRGQVRIPQLREVLDFVGTRRGKTVPLRGDGETEEIISFESLRARKLGTAFHRAVQSMRGFDAASAKRAVRRVRELQGADMPADELASVERRLVALATDAFVAHLAQGAEILREIVLLEETGTLIPDMVVVGDAGIVVIDFKTSLDDASKVRYDTQVRNYREALERVFQRPTKGYLCFVPEDGIIYKEVT